MVHTLRQYASHLSRFEVEKKDTDTILHLFQGVTFDESTDNLTVFFFSDIHLFNVQCVGVRVLLHTHDLPNLKQWNSFDKLF